MATIVEKLAEISGEIQFERLPPDVVEKAKVVILDSLGCAIGGYASPPSKMIRAIVQSMGGNEESTVIGSQIRTSAFLATLANGTMIRYLDYNDTYIGRDPSHPSGNVATVLALAERQRKGGKDVIAALVLAYEIHLRLADHCGEPSLWLRGWDHATNAAYAAAAVSARLLGLSQNKMAHALAIAGSQANTLGEIRRGVIPMMKATAEAKAAADGVLGALMAAEGMTGTLRIFEGDYGYIKILAGSIDETSLVAPVRDYKVLKSSLKYYPVETMTQALVDAALTLRTAHRIGPEHIERVVVGLYDFAFDKPAWDKSKLTPTTRESADHSYNYCVAVALLDGEVGEAQFRDERIQAADVRDLMSRVELTIDPELDGIYPHAFPGIVTVHLKGGQALRKRVDYAPGHPKNPGSRKDVEAKFRRQCERFLTQQQIGQVIEAVWELEKLERIDELMGTLWI